MSALVEAHAPELVIIWLGIACVIVSLELWTSKQRTARRPSLSFTLETLGMALAWPVIVPIIGLAWICGVRR